MGLGYWGSGEHIYVRMPFFFKTSWLLEVIFFISCAYASQLNFVPLIITPGKFSDLRPLLHLEWFHHSVQNIFYKYTNICMMCAWACFVKTKASLIFSHIFHVAIGCTRELCKGNMKRDGNKSLLLAIRILGRYLILAALRSFSSQAAGELLTPGNLP